MVVHPFNLWKTDNSAVWLFENGGRTSSPTRGWWSRKPSRSAAEGSESTEGRQRKNWARGHAEMPLASVCHERAARPVKGPPIQRAPTQGRLGSARWAGAFSHREDTKDFPADQTRLLCRDLSWIATTRTEIFPRRSTAVPGGWDMLHRHGVAHVFNNWTRMPSILEQLATDGSETADFTVSRFLLKPGPLIRRFGEDIRALHGGQGAEPGCQDRCPKNSPANPRQKTPGLHSCEQPAGGKCATHHRWISIEELLTLKKSARPLTDWPMTGLFPPEHRKNGPSFRFWQVGL